MAWDAFPLFLLGGGIIGTAIGVLVLALAPSRPSNQLLATILIAQGLFPQGVMTAFREAGTAPGWFTAAGETGIAAAIASLGFLHLLFIGQAIPHPSVAWLRRPAGAYAVLATWIATLAMLLLSGDGPVLFVFVLAVAMTAAAYSAVAAWLEIASHTPGSAPRRRATTYFVAFVTRDIGLAWMTVAAAIDEAAGIGTWPYVAGRTVMLLSHILIAVALLKGQVLGLNRKIASGTSYAAAVALLTVVFVVATERIERWVSAGDDTVGIVCAVVLTLLLRPVQEGGMALLVRAFPSTRSLAHLPAGERTAMYREQAELAWADGVVGAAERRMLDRMAAMLEIPARQATAIERAARPAPAARPGMPARTTA